MGLLRKALRGLKKPPGVIAYRALQEARLVLMSLSKGWPRLERSVARHCSEDRARAFSKAAPVLLDPHALQALREAADRGEIEVEALIVWGREFRERDFEILGAPAPPSGPWPWHTDWRFAHTWPPGPFQSYNYYVKDRAAPYDVKIPWELSRLWFLVPILQAEALGDAAMDEDAGTGKSRLREAGAEEQRAEGCGIGDSPPRDAGGVEVVAEVLADWEQSNPLAHSIGWYPMESSMRAVSLVMVADMLRLLEVENSPLWGTLLRLCAQHGEFIRRTLEYTDIRENHYSANLAALLFLGLALAGHYPGAAGWWKHAARRIPREIELQFLPDGVNFEKAIGYHRLVTELFLLSAIALERRGLRLAPAIEERLHKACRYTAACQRPDGLASNVGDSDDAWTLVFDPLPIRDHSPLMALGAVRYGDGELVAGKAAALWVMGGAVFHPREQQEQRLPAEAGAPSKSMEVRYFEAGGVVVVREGSNFLWVDVGEVGLAGRGGHGHNDLLSFELMLGGSAVVVDPGCYVYTADAEARNLFRSSAYHNGLVVDGQEIAPMSGLWWIQACAEPRDVQVERRDDRALISAAHTGYLRLQDPVLHRRRLDFETAGGHLECMDRLECKGRHQIERHLHLASSIEAKLEGQRARLAITTRTNGNGDSPRRDSPQEDAELEARGHRGMRSRRSALHESVLVEWDEGTRAEIIPGWISPGYGTRTEAPILRLTDTIIGETELRFSIHPEK